MIYLGIGCNLPFRLKEKLKNIDIVIKNLSKLVSIKKISNLYLTPSYPDKTKPKFINFCMKVDTKMSAKKLLINLKKIEYKMGRIRKYKNAPRTCDIDILDFKQKIMKTSKLVIPHPQMHLRNFVLYPLNEISPGWKHPVYNRKIDYFIKSLTNKSRLEITRLKKSDIRDL